MQKVRILKKSCLWWHRIESIESWTYILTIAQILLQFHKVTCTLLLHVCMFYALNSAMLPFPLPILKGIQLMLHSPLSYSFSSLSWAKSFCCSESLYFLVMYSTFFSPSSIFTPVKTIDKKYGSMQSKMQYREIHLRNAFHSVISYRGHRMGHQVLLRSTQYLFLY